MKPASKVFSILVGIDYSTASEVALEHALGLAVERPEAILHVVHVIPGPREVPTSDKPQMPDEPLLDSPALRELDRHVALSIGAFDKKRPVRASSDLRVMTHLRAHEPAHQVAQLASDLEVDMVVVGTHGRGAVARFFMGSVAERVARLAPCSVLVFRPKGTPPEYPSIEPPCPECVEARAASGGRDYWCEQHRGRQGQRHGYKSESRHVHQQSNLPLVFDQKR